MTKFLIEKILKLFAILVFNGISQKYQKRINFFLNNNVSKEYREKYREMFENFIKKHESHSSYKKLSLNSVKLIKYCEEIVENTNLDQRITIFVNLLNFIKSSDKFNNEQIDFLNIASELLGISKNDYNNFIYFAEKKYDLISKNNIVFHNINSKNLIVLLKTSTSFILLKSLEKSVFINSQKCQFDYIYILDYHSIIKTIDLKELNYSDLNQIFNSSEKEKQFQLYVNNISFKIDNQTILHETSFVAQSSEMIGIIGKSGSGKSSLLYVLSGVYPIGKGDLFIKKDNKNTTYFQTSFVEQDNNFIDGFSVEEHLIDRAKYLQLSDDESYKKIKKILVQVDLYYHRHKIAKFNNSLNGELSGGQKKRLNIALSLLQNPDLILMDEPSSGLSSIETLKIFRLLKSISLLNKIVICSVHQPDISVFSMFDKIIVISEQGYPAFYGKPSEAAEYFRNTAERIDNESVFGQNYKPGVIIDILDDKKLNIQAQTWYQEYRNKNPNNKADIVDKNELNKKIIKLNWFLSVKEFITREIKILKKNPLITSLFLIIPILLAVLLSFISKYSISEEYSYYLNPNIPAWILMLLVSAIFIGLISSGHEFIYLRNYRKSENIIYYKFNSYAFSKIIKVFVITVFQALILSFLSAYIIEMKTNEFKFFLIVWLLCFFGATLGLLLSKLFSSISMVYFLAPLIIIPQILFAGAIIEYKNFNNFIRNEKYVPLIADLIPLRWASEAIMVDLFKNNKFEKNVFNANVLINEAVYYLDYFFPEFENINKTQNVRANFILLSENAKNHFFSKDNHKLITETANEIKNSYFNLKINSLNYRDSIYNGMSDKLILKKKYSNHALNNLLCKKHDFNNYIIEDFEIIRRYMPIYKLPDFDSYRTHFFSPYKRFFNRFIDTYWFNVLVLLLMTGLLMIFLFDYNKRQKKNYNSS